MIWNSHSRSSNQAEGELKSLKGFHKHNFSVILVRLFLSKGPSAISGGAVKFHSDQIVITGALTGSFSAFDLDCESQLLLMLLLLLSGKNRRLSSIFDSCWRNEVSNFYLRKFE